MKKIESYKKIKTEQYDGSKSGYDDDPTYYQIPGRRGNLASKIQNVMMVNMSESALGKGKSKKRKNGFDFIRSDNEEEDDNSVDLTGMFDCLFCIL